MAFQYVTGTALAAPDEIVAWFAAFQTFISSCGWTIEAGAGTTDLTISSTGEDGGLTMLFARIQRDGVFVNWIRVELQDDLAGTHVTTNAGQLDSTGGNFTYWMAGDRDAFIIVTLAGATWRSMYAGLVMPFGIAPPDETYRMIVANRAPGGVGTTILRRFDGLWDQDDQLYENEYIRVSNRDRLDNMLTIGGCYHADQDEIAGQLYHISGRISDAGVALYDTISSGPGTATEWIVLRDRIGIMFAVRTGGAIPLGVDLTGSALAHEAGLVNTVEALFDTVLPTFLTAVGWTVDAMPGSPNHRDIRCYSTGELGTDTIWVRFRYTLQGVTEDTIGVMVMDDATGTHVAGPTDTMDLLRFPTRYWITADLDCVCLVLDRSGEHIYMYGGALYSFAAVPSTPYKSVADRFILRSHGGLWTQVANPVPETAYLASSPNQYDLNTWELWQVLQAEALAGARYEIDGQRKYFKAIAGGIASCDVVAYEDRSYLAFYTGAVGYALRTV